MHTYNPSTSEKERPEIQDHSWLHSEYEANLDYVRLRLKTEQNKTGKALVNLTVALKKKL